jgi:hypothetical protein
LLARLATSLSLLSNRRKPSTYVVFHVTAVFLGLDPATCPKTYPCTKAGLCHGCGTSHASIPRSAEEKPGYWRFAEGDAGAPRDVVFHATSAFDARELARKFMCRDVPNSWTMVDVGDDIPEDCVAFNKVAR